MAYSVAGAARAGRMMGNYSLEIDAATQATSTKWDEVTANNIKNRARLESQVMKADAAVKQAEIKSEMIEKKSDMDIDLFKAKVASGKQQRMAGHIAAAGKFIGAGLTKEPDPIMPTKADYSAYEQLLEKRKADAYGPDKTDDTDIPESLISDRPSFDEWRQKGGKTGTPLAGALTDSSKTATGSSKHFDISKLTDQDYQELAYIVSGEAARGTKDEFGVAAAVLNRVASGKWPNTIKEVGHQKGQFEAVEMGTARYDSALAQKLKNNPDELNKALNTLAGRDSFKGQALLKNRVAAEDPMFDAKGNYYHHSWQT